MKDIKIVWVPFTGSGIPCFIKGDNMVYLNFVPVTTIYLFKPLFIPTGVAFVFVYFYLQNLLTRI